MLYSHFSLAPWDAARWPNFTPQEFACSHCGELRVDELFMDSLQALRTSMGFSFPVNSGYRCPTHNDAESSTGLTGPHTKAAVDIGVFGERAFRIIGAAKSFGFIGIGVKQHGPHEKRFVHLDMLPNEPGQPRPWIWSYK